MSPVVIGNATLYLGDCLDILPTLPKVDAVITDPPYGIGARLVRGGRGGTFDMLINSGADEWDVKPSADLLRALIDMANVSLIWGGNFLELPPCDKPLCWNKLRPNQKNLSEWEYCWTTLVGRAEMITHCANGGFVSNEERVHPTQKPTPVMRWCIQKAGNPQTILDPFMGSGSTGVAAMELGRSFIGIERDARYFDIACRRIENAQRQETLFAPEPQTQEALL
jgi:site-specific DNA-methyltransferase (adenine-specific)/modification methylase